MPKTSRPNPYLDEDILLLMLKILDHPEGAKSVFYFDELRKEKYKEIKIKELFDWIVDFIKDNRLKPTDFAFGDRKEWEDYDGDKLEKLLEYMGERKHLLDQIMNTVNFRIKIGKTARNELLNTFKKYIRSFIDGKLDYGKNRYLSFAKHKEKFLNIVKNYFERIGKELWINDSDFGKEYRFLECVLSLETQGYFRCNSLKFNGDFYEAKIYPMKKLSDALGDHGKTENENASRVSLKLPKNLIWENISIKFLNGHEVNVQIKKGKNDRFDFNDFRCVNRKNGSPDKQWELLKEISDSGNKLIIDRDTDEKVREKYRQRKMILAGRLRNFFNLKDDPFRRDFERHGLYYPRFKLLPEPSMREYP